MVGKMKKKNAAQKAADNRFIGELIIQNSRVIVVVEATCFEANNLPVNLLVNG